jgi:hypothetical protein
LLTFFLDPVLPNSGYDDAASVYSIPCQSTSSRDRIADTHKGSADSILCRHIAGVGIGASKILIVLDIVHA